MAWMKLLSAAKAHPKVRAAAASGDPSAAPSRVAAAVLQLDGWPRETNVVA